jgi:uncharacterized membrane protein
MSHRADNPVPPEVRRRLWVAVVVLFVATAAGMVLLWPSGDPPPGTEGLRLIEDVHDAEVVKLDEIPCPGTLPEQEIICPIAEVRLLSGPDEGEEHTVPLPQVFADAGLEAGDRVAVGVNVGAPEDQTYTLLDRDRQSILLILAGLFFLAVVVLGGLRGSAAIVGLAASISVLLVFVLPAILDGQSPIWVAIVGASAIAFLALLTAHGFTPMTAVALLGTLGALAVTAGLAALFIALAEITGVASEEASLVNVGAAQIDIRGLILAGVVLGGLGAIDDMTVTQASAVWELRAASPGLSDRLLFRAAMRIGRDHVASTVNTLALAYAGASMPLLVLFVLSGQSLGAVANSEVVATEIVRTLVGSIGLVTAVPLTTWLASRAVRRSDEHAPGAGGPPDVEEGTEGLAGPAPAVVDPEIDPDRDFWKGV